MREPEIVMLVKCPECGRESLCSLMAAAAADALLSGGAIQLGVGCHAHEWNADLWEREQLREYLGATNIRERAAVSASKAEVKGATVAAPWPQYSILRHMESGTNFNGDPIPVARRGVGPERSGGRQSQHR
jgi:hypothetical protein